MFIIPSDYANDDYISDFLRRKYKDYTFISIILDSRNSLPIKKIDFRIFKKTLVLHSSKKNPK